MSIVKVGSIINPTTGDTTATDSLSQQVCTAWVNFDGTTGTIRASFNVSSVTRVGVGQYTISFSTPMATANYSVSWAGSSSTTSSSEHPALVKNSLTTSSVTVNWVYTVYLDVTEGCVAIFGGK